MERLEWLLHFAFANGRQFGKHRRSPKNNIGAEQISGRQSNTGARSEATVLNSGCNTVRTNR
jgi:hypothetical protein